MKQLYSIKLTISIFAVALLSIALPCAAQEPKQEPKQETPQSKVDKDKEIFDQKIDDAQSRFDQNIEQGQQRFDQQIKNAGKPSKEKKKPKKQKQQKPKKEKTEKPTADRDVVELKVEPSAVKVKAEGFTQKEGAADATSVVRGIKVSASEPITNITPEKARSEAIRKAKEEALRIAVGEEIQASTTVVDAGNTNAAIARISNIGSRGGVVALSFDEDKIEVDANGASVYKVTITADVKIYPKQTTPHISFHLTGIKPAYTERERLTFSVTSSDSCYLYIFLFDSRNIGTMLVPSRSEPNNRLSKLTATEFPSNIAIQYTLTLDNPISAVEENTLLVVAFRQAMPVTPQIYSDLEKTLCWIYNFDPALRSQDIEAIPIRVYPRQ